VEPSELADLRRAIRDLHGAESEYMDSHAVIEAFEGKIAWQGTVHRFRLKGHKIAQEAYAWSHAIDGSSERRYVAVLRGGAIDLPGDAVRAAIRQEIAGRKPR